MLGPKAPPMMRIIKMLPMTTFIRKISRRRRNSILTNMWAGMANKEKTEENEKEKKKIGQVHKKQHANLASRHQG